MDFSRENCSKIVFLVIVIKDFSSSILEAIFVFVLIFCPQHSLAIAQHKYETSCVYPTNGCNETLRFSLFFISFQCIETK